MVKKVLIEIRLVKESAEVPNDVIEKEISEWLSEEFPKIPWYDKVQKVTVMEAC